MRIEFDRIAYSFEGKSYTLLLNKAASDQYTDGLRRAPRTESFLYYILARAAAAGRTLRMADIGANVGGTVLPIAAHGIDVLAVEALPTNFICLASAVRENGFANVLPVNMAVYDGAGVVTIVGQSAFAKVNANPNAARLPGSFSVAADSLAAILRTYNYSDLDIIKIDVEGAELAALTGAELLFAENPGLDIIYECNSHTARFFGHNQQALTSWFNERGFTTYILNRRSVIPLSGTQATPQFLIDMLATKRSPQQLYALGWKLLPLTDKFVLDALLAEARHGHKMKAAHIRQQEPYLTESMSASAAWQEIISLLAKDDVQNMNS